MSEPTGDQSPKVKLLCPSCGADAVMRDAFATWDEDAQEWELHSVYDTFACNSCGAEFKEPTEEEIVDGDADQSGEQAPPET